MKFVKSASSTIGLFVGSVILLFASAGCGGGGTGPTRSGNGVLTVFTNFSAGAATAGITEEIQVRRADGSVVTTQTLAAATVAQPQSTVLSGLPSGTLTVHAVVKDAFSNVTGVLDTTINGGTATALTTSLDLPVNSLVVTPSSANIVVGDTQKFYASGQAITGELVFTPVGAITWTSDSATATVNASTGVATGVSEGSPHIIANYSGLQAQANLTVQTATVTRSKWTVMVFLNASNDLYQFAKPNVNQIEKIANNPDVRFVIQWKDKQNVGGNSSPFINGTKRFLAKFDTSSSLPSIDRDLNPSVVDLGDGVDMGEPAALNDFISWSMARYPADHYAVVMWNHGLGWVRSFKLTRPPVRGISYDDETGNHIDAWQMSQAIGAHHIDILAYDACLMQMIELAAEVQNKVDFMAGSEENTPGPGYPYDKVFLPMVTNPDATPRELSQGLVTGFINTYSQSSSGYFNSPVCQSVIDVAKVPALLTSIDGLGSALISNPTLTGSAMPAIRSAASGSRFNTSYPFYYDLTDIVTRIRNANISVQINNAANAVLTSAADAVVINGSHNEPFANGIGLEFSRSSGVSGLYSNLKIAQTTHWDDFLFNPLANP